MHNQPIADAPLKAVVIGGGSGSPASIKALLSLGLETTSVVAMADDGGSTGLLREEADVTPPGDIRKCLVAMAKDPEQPLIEAFRTRFQFCDNHTLGNLILVALEQATGSFPEAIRLCEDLMGAQGRVHPSTLAHVRMMAQTRAGHRVDGQVNACHAAAPLDRAWLEADTPISAYAPAMEAIAQADLIVLGPGSLYTSIIANLLVPGIAQAICASNAPVVFACGVADVQGETRGLSMADHLRALFRHGLEGRVDYVLAHCPSSAPEGVRLVSCGEADLEYAAACGVTVMPGAYARQGEPLFHDVAVLSAAYREVLAACPSLRR